MSYIIVNKTELRGHMGELGMVRRTFDVQLSGRIFGEAQVAKYSALNLSDLVTAEMVARSIILNKEVRYIQSCAMARRNALAELSEALSELLRVGADLKELNSTGTISAETVAILNKHGIENNGTTTTKGEFNKISQRTENAMDLINNDMDQDLVRLQSIFSKRDDALELADKLADQLADAVGDSVSTVAQ